MQRRRSSYKRAFETSQSRSGVNCRFYDARHTFVTRLAENATVSIETIRHLAGHVNDRMFARYSHIRVQARRNAIATLERGRAEARPFDSKRRAQSLTSDVSNAKHEAEKRKGNEV